MKRRIASALVDRASQLVRKHVGGMGGTGARSRLAVEAAHTLKVKVRGE